MANSANSNSSAVLNGDALVAAAQQAVGPIKVERGELYFDAARGIFHDTERYADAPTRMRGETKVFGHESFISYLKDYAGSNARIYLDNNVVNPTYLAVLDHYSREFDAPEWQSWLLRLEFRTTPEWDTWVKSEMRGMSQGEFAEFIEDNRKDIVEPDSADLMEIIKTMEARNGIEFRSAVRLDNGQVQFQVNENLVAKAGGDGTMVIPQTFKLGLKPFDGIDAYKVEARLRWRLKEGQVSFFYRLERRVDIIRSVLTDVDKAIQEAGHKVLLGLPHKVSGNN